MLALPDLAKMNVNIPATKTSGVNANSAPPGVSTKAPSPVVKPVTASTNTGITEIAITAPTTILTHFKLLHLLPNYTIQVNILSIEKGIKKF